jgi:hypothetical protein
MMAKTNKYIYETIIQGLWCGMWSDECGASSSQEAKRTLKEYRDNCPGTQFRIIHRRELNPAYGV